MPSERRVMDSFWEDPWVENQTKEVSYLYLYLLTNPKANLAGIYELTDRQMIFHTKFSSEELQKTLEHLKAEKKILRWNNWVVMKNTPKHQALGNPKIISGIERILTDLPKDLLLQLPLFGYSFPGTAELIINLYGIDSLPIPDGCTIDTIKNQENRQYVGYRTLLNSTLLNLTSLNGKTPELSTTSNMFKDKSMAEIFESLLKAKKETA